MKDCIHSQSKRVYDLNFADPTNSSLSAYSDDAVLATLGQAATPQTEADATWSDINTTTEVDPSSTNNGLAETDASKVSSRSDLKSWVSSKLQPNDIKACKVKSTAQSESQR